MYVGQDEQESPEDAAARAAYDQALDSDLPPHRSDVGKIGGAAGGAAAAAACTAYGAGVAAPLCASIGTAIGSYISTAVYDIFDGLFAGETYVAPQYDHVMYQRTRRAAIRLAKLRVGDKYTSEQIAAETENLEEWGVPAATLAAGRGPTEAERGPWKPYYSEQGLDSYLAKLTAAESALASGVIAAQKLGRKAQQLKAPPKRGASLTTIAVATAGIGGAIWLLASLL